MHLHRSVVAALPPQHQRLDWVALYLNYLKLVLRKTHFSDKDRNIVCSSPRSPTEKKTLSQCYAVVCIFVVVVGV